MQSRVFPMLWPRLGVVLLTTQVLFALALVTSKVAAEDSASELRRTLRELERSRAEQERQIRELERRLEELERKKQAETVREKKRALEQVLEEAAAPQPFAGEVAAMAGPGGTRLRLIDLSFDVLAAAGWSTAQDEDLGGRLQAGAHDPVRRGFTLQQGELSLIGAVDPYFTGEGHLIFTNDHVELEEAFFTTTSLPHGLQVKAGYFFTEYGLLNPVHPHAWHWMDQPVILSRLFGGEGLRSPGLRLSWLTPLPWFSELFVGAQNANEGERTLSFLASEGIGGRPAVVRSTRRLDDLLFLLRWEQFFELTEQTGLQLGANLLHGPNSTGVDAQAWIYGIDWKVRWRPQNHFRGWPFFLWQTEILKRDYTAEPFIPGTALDRVDDGHGHDHGHDHAGEDIQPKPPPDSPIPGAILRDVGFYTQVLFGFRYGWATGLRLEYASGDGASLQGRSADPLRDDRFRLSPLLLWQPTEFSRLRLQYNYDRARFLSERDAHSIWLGGEVLYGAHPAHKY